MKRTDAPPEYENPYQSPDEVEKLVDRHWAVVIELVVGSIFLFALSGPVYYYVDSNFGMAASGIAAVVAIRAGIDVQRKLAADCLQRGGALKSLAISLFLVGATCVAAYVACFTTCFAAASIFNHLYDQNIGLLVLISFGSGGVVGLSVGSALLYYLGPASVEMLRRTRTTENSTNVHAKEEV
ncbi:hypothetical protein LOC68_26850 [Blastopirellula sp. JC732]|uniref:Uncharacterized protein n=1 Tax=Blastopirellula sediminis TaxID=2894196 RepID=A0A9X1MR63_9BACT|nr:hypothetical protein [Blastopirellula sediminis]MCC9604673.1 hypothetical protein [Blastopirellula sediminis]MCC9632028.1 hypothetical protein [Blastopirellula sediminis]